MKRLSTPRIRVRDHRYLKTRLLRHEKRLSRRGYSLIAGVDEAGRGPLAGPVVASAVILKNYDFECQIDDSKKLTAKKREKAYDEIMEKAIVGVGIVDEKTIDEINIYHAAVKAMQMAISNLRIPPDYVIVDGRIKLPIECPVRSIVRGDSQSMSIAAASIIAKVTRDRIMLEYDKIFPQYGFARHKGYPTKSHKEAIKKYGIIPIHRRSFKPVLDYLPDSPYRQARKTSKKHNQKFKNQLLRVGNRMLLSYLPDE
ncbi:MAG: ribonuclease HII [Candidatus Omnitrophica bacterium]|nr:ribonuclease HII [Candidatus Omnitrophota bacterium]MCM8790750.1 ribonuclease HII [Candidatus Omnitrophota bacterium]